jgi:hypothetical protein
MLLATDSAEPIEWVGLSLRVDWERQPVSVHSEDAALLERLILFLRNQHNVKKRSIVMPDREVGGFLFFIYQICDPRWIAAFLETERGDSNG